MRFCKGQPPMSTRTRRMELSQFLRRAPGLNEAEGLLELLPHAALLIETNQERIMGANFRAVELTAYTRQELTQLKLNELLPELEEKVNGAPRKLEGRQRTRIIQRSGSQLHATTTLHPLGPHSPWAALTLEPRSVLQAGEDPEELEREKWEALKSIVQAPQDPRIELALEHILQAGQVLTGASLLAIYLPQQSGDALTLAALWGILESLPDEINFDDAREIVSKQDIWTPGKRGSTTLHRAALASKYTYMVTAPIFPEQPIEGLLVVADQIAAPSEDLRENSEIVCTASRTALQYRRLLDGIEHNITNQRPEYGVLSALRDHVSDGVVLVNGEMRVVEINRAAEGFLGYKSKEVTDKPVESVLVDLIQLPPAIRSALEGIATPDLGDLHIRRRDGQAMTARVQTLPLRRDGKIETVAILITDLSDHEAYRVHTQELEQRALLGEFSAIFAHEVRNPINNLSTGLQLMAMNLPPDDPHQAQIQRLRQDCERLAHLMKSVLAVSGSQDFRPEAVDVGELAEQILERWAPRLERMKIRWAVKKQPNTEKVFADPKSLEQVLTNLLSNAAQAMAEKGGTLTVIAQNARDKTATVEVNVSDTGPGIPKEIRERIFEPFFTTRREGAGLGLAITRRNVLANKGTITVESVPGGTIFQVRLPKAQG